MSTDSTLTLRSPATPERFLEERVRRPATPAVPSSYSVHGSMVPQPPTMSRTTSIHHTSSADIPGDHRSRVTSMQGHPTTPIRLPISSASLNELTEISSTSAGYNGQLPTHIPEYTPSTISDLEVDQRDRIAKINAEYNAVSSASSSSYYSNDNAAVAVESILRRMSTSPPKLPSPDTFMRTPSQPLYANPHFPTKSDDSNSTFNSNPSIFSTKDGSPPLVERVPSRQLPSSDIHPGHFLPVQGQDGWSRDGNYNSDPRVSPHAPSPTTSNHLFDNGTASLPRSTQTTYATSQETISLNEYRPLPVPPPEAPRQRSTAERRPSVVGPRPDANVLKGVSDARHRSQTAREYSYDRSELRRDVSNSPPREGSTLQSSSRELPNRAALASDVRRDTRTPAPRESNDYRPAPPTRYDSYVDPQKPPVEPHSKTPHPTDTRNMYNPPPLTSSPISDLEAPKPHARSHLQPDTFVGPLDTERSNVRTRTRSTSFVHATRPNLPSPVSNLGQQPSPSQQYHGSDLTFPDPRRVPEQDKPVRTSPPSRMQENFVYHSDYVEPEGRNDAQGSSSSQAVYNNQPVTPTFNQDTHSSQRRNLPFGQPSNDRAPSFPTINSRNPAQGVPNSRSRASYVEGPTAHTNSASLPTHGTTLYDKLSMPVKVGSVGGYTSSSNSTNQKFVTPEQPPQRRYSDGDQNPPPRPVESLGRSSAPLVRSVRWTENLICPSPIFASQRRKGWFNRRG